MKIGFVFFGIIYGPGGRTGSDRDFRHCWPNLKSMLIDPFVEMGHEAVVYFSGYELPNKELETEFYDLIKPRAVTYSKFEGSDPFTAKGNAFFAFENDDLDVIVFTRSDIHFSKVIAKENVDFDKFNLLFREKDWWESHNFACDNLYIFPHSMTQAVKIAMFETYGYPRGKPLVDTHAILDKLMKYVPPEQINFISDVHENSDVNSYYTCCRSGLPTTGRGEHIHPEVAERFYK